MLNRLFILSIFIALLCDAANAEVKLLLKPKAATDGKNLTLCDIALLEGNNSSIEQIKNINIEPEIFSDGYIDKKEILTFLKKYTQDNCIIYGDSVRIIFNDLQNKNFSEQNDLFLKRGDRVEVIINNKGVSLILKGIAANDGKFNEEITVKINLKSTLSKVLKGKMISKEIVEVNI
jgi:hypothetical protein